jgi:hypothetical protein
MTTEIELVGIYPVDADAACHLVELVIRNSTGPIDFTGFTQPVPRVIREDWQVPWGKMLLDSDGQACTADSFDMSEFDASDWVGDLRVIFFFLYLDLSLPLQTPFGEVPIQPVTSRPDRLAFVEYEPP